MGKAPVRVLQRERLNRLNEDRSETLSEEMNQGFVSVASVMMGVAMMIAAIEIGR